MVKVRTLLVIAVAAMAIGAAQAATVIDTDFSKGSAGWVLNGTAELLDPQTAGVTQVLSLTQNEGSQAGAAWTEAKQTVPSFSFTADIRVRWGMTEGCPADGLAMAFADTDADKIGAGGGHIGLFNNPDEIGRFIALDINTWYDQGIGSGDCNASPGRGETIAFANMKPDYPGSMEDPDTGRAGYDRHSGQNKPGDPAKGGFKLGQTLFPAGFKLVDGGTYRFQWNVDGATNTMSAYVTGLDASNNTIQKVKVAEVKSGLPVLDFPGRWGITAGTGGAVQHTEVLRARVDVPMIDPL